MKKFVAILLTVQLVSPIALLIQICALKVSHCALMDVSIANLSFAFVAVCCLKLHNIDTVKAENLIPFEIHLSKRICAQTLACVLTGFSTCKVLRTNATSLPYE